MQKAIAIVGPTAVGKTDLSLSLAKKFAGEIISGDSMQIYRNLDVGTAKIMPAQRSGIAHHLIDIVNVNQSYTVHDFQTEATKLITQINQRNHVPFVVGGTGFYINALANNFNLGGQIKADHVEREYYQQYTAQQLWDLLASKDELAAEKIPVANQRRVIRALEVIEATGKPFSKQVQLAPEIDFLVIGLNTERSLLYHRINQRVDLMEQQGLQQEALWLSNQDAPQASQAIGYKEYFPYFANEYSHAQALELIKRNSRRFAKRQLTYFRNQMTIQWYDILQNPEQIVLIEQVIHKFLEE